MPLRGAADENNLIVQEIPFFRKTNQIVIEKMGDISQNKFG